MTDTIYKTYVVGGPLKGGHTDDKLLFELPAWSSVNDGDLIVNRYEDGMEDLSRAIMPDITGTRDTATVKLLITLLGEPVKAAAIYKRQDYKTGEEDQ